MTIENKEVVQAGGVNLDDLPKDAQGNVADLTQHTDGAPQRFTEKEVLAEAGTDAHAEVLNGEGVKDRVEEVLKGTAAKLSEELFDAVAVDLHGLTAKLRQTKGKEERAKLLSEIGDTKHRLGLVLENFL